MTILCTRMENNQRILNIYTVKNASNNFTKFICASVLHIHTIFFWISQYDNKYRYMNLESSAVRNLFSVWIIYTTQYIHKQIFFLNFLHPSEYIRKRHKIQYSYVYIKREMMKKKPYTKLVTITSFYF